MKAKWDLPFPGFLWHYVFSTPLLELHTRTNCRTVAHPGRRNGNPLQYSCLENPMDCGAWWAIVHGVAESWTQLNWLNTLNPHLEICLNVHFPLYPYRLTAFVTKCFAQAQQFIFIDDKNIQDALEWMAGNQLSSGCYDNVGNLLHTAMKVRPAQGPGVPEKNLTELDCTESRECWPGVWFFRSLAWLRGDLCQYS